jgi:urease beta subunit
VDLGAGGACLEVCRSGGDVVHRRLDGAAYALRRVLCVGRTLEAAAAAAVAADPGFDFGTGLFELFGDGMVVGVEMSTPRRKGTT